MSAFFALNHPAATEQTKEVARQLRADLEAQLQLEQIEVAKARAQNLSLQAIVTSLLNAGPCTELRSDEGQAS